MAKVKEPAKYKNKDGFVLLESTKFEYDKSVFLLTSNSYYLSDSKIEKKATFEKDSVTYSKDKLKKETFELVAAPHKWLGDNGYTIC